MNKVVGRPKKNELEKLTEFVNIRFSVSELEKVEQKSNRLNISRSEYLRATALDNLSNIPAFCAIPKLIKEEFLIIRRQINFLRILGLKSDFPLDEIPSIIIDLHKIVAKTEKIVLAEIENQHIKSIEVILSDLKKMIEKDDFSKAKCLNIKDEIEKILIEKKNYFKI